MGSRPFRVLTAAVVAATVALTLATSATAAGHITAAGARFYSDYVHYTLRFNVFDARGYCVKDEYGFYKDYDCENYDSKDATLDVRAFRLRPGMAPRRVYSEEIYGLHGRATEDLYDWELKAPYSARHGTVIRYRVSFRLFDPITDRAVDQVNRYFHISY